MKSTKIILAIMLFVIAIKSYSNQEYISQTSQKAPDEKKVLETMKQATRFMMEKVSYNGAFVWSYLPDLSRQWGELEAYRTMGWTQNGTPDVGHALLDMYHATGDEYYYEQAKKVANALIWGQLPCGGWNYIFDFAGENSLKQWYATIGKHAWGFEEFYHYYGNATFDDYASTGPSKFLLRMYVEKYDPVYLPALEKAIQFMLESQYPNGGWPQRYPLKYDHIFREKPDYTSYVTLNDDVTPDIINFFIQCLQALGSQRLREPTMRAMYLMIILQQGAPYAGWGEQYTVDDLKPTGARSYEPHALSTSVTVRMIRNMVEYYKLTGDTRFLVGIPNAISFLESQALPESEIRRFTDYYGKPSGDNLIFVPNFIDPDTGIPQYVHRRGRNIYTGEYYVDQDITNTIGHYSSGTWVNIPSLKKLYNDALALSPALLKAESPLYRTELTPLPKYYSRLRSVENLQNDIATMIQNLTKDGYWLTPILNSHPYKEITKEAFENMGDIALFDNSVVDEYDTTPFPTNVMRFIHPNYSWNFMGISTSTYVSNMRRCISYLESLRTR